jgi:hypothetical protein
MTGFKTNSGEHLLIEWKIPARQARYHKDGTWFMPLERFPGALCDPKGYIIFNSRHDYESAHYLEIGERLNVRQGICKLPGYVRVR